MPVRVLASLVLVALLAPAVRAQTVVELTVVDAETGAPLPGATAQSRRTPTLGAAADAAGRLRLALPAAPDTLVVRFLGYAPAQLVIRAGLARVERRLRLAQDVQSIGEVVVSAEPMGERIWRRVLARRQALAARLGRYTAEAYTRLVLQRKGPLDVAPVAVGWAETLSNVAWDARQGAREEVVARRRAPARPFRYATTGPVPDLYFENVLALDGRAVPSPTHPDALRDYAFRLGETVEADGRRYLDLAVVPRRGGLVAGRIRIVDSLFVIAEADLRADRIDREPSVQDFEADYTWTYAPASGLPALGDSLWLPAAFERRGSVTPGIPGRTVPTVRFRQTSHLSRVVPRGADPVEAAGRRYRSPRGVYGGAEVFAALRLRYPPDSLDAAAEGTRRLRTAAWAELLPAQTGLQFSFGIPGFAQTLGLDLNGDDDE